MKMGNKKGQISGVMLTLGLVAIMAVILLGVMFTFLRDNALDTQTANETLAITLNATTALGNEDIIASSFVLKNVSGATLNIGGSNYTLETTYGSLIVGNVTSEEPNHVLFDGTSGTLYAEYNYYPGAYATGVSRTIISVIPVMLALVLLIFVVGYINLKQ